MAEMLMLPIGEEYFSDIRKKGFYYVDKTRMLSDFFRSRGFVNLFTRPRHFGKSLNIDMFKCFLEAGTDPSLFKGLAIEKDRSICDAHMGQYPVISISLKDVEGGSYEKALDGMASLLSEEARRHGYLLESNRLSSSEKQSLNSLLAPYPDEKKQREFLRLLSEMLSKHYQKKAVILIDEYDVPLDKAWQKGYYTEMVEHIRAILSRALKTNPFLEFAVITGCLRVARESIFTGINNFFVNSVSDTAYAEYFGFTDPEVRQLLAYYGLSDHYNLLREWYDGYCFGTKQLYCPWDVICQTWKFRKDPDALMESYWANSSSNYIIKTLLEKPTEATRADIEKLISGEAVVKTIRPELTYADLRQENQKTRQTFLWSVLYSTGYLTDKKAEPTPESRNPAASGLARRLVIPNREVRNIYEMQIRSWFEQNVCSQETEWRELCSALIGGDAETVQNRLNFFLTRSISIRDTAARKEYKENFYHGLLLGLLETNGNWTVGSNAESGTGYLDIEVLSYSTGCGCAIEVKYAENGNFEAACSEAMQQIRERDYAEALRQEDMKTIHKYGIAFYKKSCRVSHEKE